MASENAAGARPAPQKHVSGMLIGSLLLSLAGFLYLLVIGPVVGLLLGLYGRKRVLANPMLVGPRFALWCIVIAATSIPVQGWVFYVNYPGMALSQNMGPKVSGFFEDFKKRDYEAVYDRMAPEWRKTHTLEEMTGMIQKVFPGKEKIDLPDDRIEFQEDYDVQQAQKEFKAWLSSDYPSELTITFPVAVNREEGEPRAGIDLAVRLQRSGYADFDVTLTDFAVKTLPPKKKEAAKEEGAVPSKSTGQPGESGGGPAEKPAAGEGTKTPEGDSANDPR